MQTNVYKVRAELKKANALEDMKRDIRLCRAALDALEANLHTAGSFAPMPAQYASRLVAQAELIDRCDDVLEC